MQWPPLLLLIPSSKGLKILWAVLCMASSCPLTLPYSSPSMVSMPSSTPCQPNSPPCKLGARAGTSAEPVAMIYLTWQTRMSISAW